MIGIGVDIGGGSIKAGLFNGNGEILREHTSKTHSNMKNEDFQDALIHSLDPIIYDKSISNLGSIQGIGIGSPGPIDNELGIIYGSANLPKLNSYHIVDFIKSYYGLEAVLNNDANSAALGEYYFGPGKGSSNLFVFTLGTGLGGGWVERGRLYNGYRGNGMEVGHITIVHGGALCGCGQLGCAEAYFSAKGLNARYFAKSSAPLDKASELFELARSGDRYAVETIREGTDILAEASRNIVNLLNVDTIVFVGGLTASWDYFENQLVAGIRSKAFPVLTENLKIFSGKNNAILGAGALLMERLEARNKLAENFMTNSC